MFNSLTLASILKAFDLVSSQLTSFLEQNKEKQELVNTKIGDLEEQASNLRAEQAKASKVLENIKKLTS